MAEVGVYTGEFCKLFNRYFPERKLYLFDTFEGFDSKRDLVNEVDLDEFKDTSVDIVLSKMNQVVTYLFMILDLTILKRLNKQFLNTARETML